MRLQGKTALITGGSSGIELATALYSPPKEFVRSGRLFLLETEWRSHPLKDPARPSFRQPLTQSRKTAWRGPASSSLR